MTKNENRKYAYFILYLIRCVLAHRSPLKEKIERLELSKLYKIANAHSLASITASALDMVGIFSAEFVEVRLKTIRNTISYDAERKTITDKLDSNGIWYVPLKGIILKNYYPNISMREMADNDILIPKEKSDIVKRLMSELKYVNKTYGIGNCDSYYKLPIYNFELHTQLFIDTENELFSDYYHNIYYKLIKSNFESLCYGFTNEDFYIYMTAHEYKHFSQGGTGLRSLVDAYVFLNHFSGMLDMEYIDDELDKLGIKEYEHKRRKLVFDIFDKGKINSEQKALLDYYIFSGTYGNIENRVKNSTDKSVLSKIKYISKRVFLPLSSLKNAYPFFYKHKYLIPFLFIFRLALAVTKSRKKVLSEIMALIK